MLTWNLWRALRHPPTRNPLFRRAYVSPEQPLPWHIGCLQWLGVVLFLPIITFAANIYGLGWSVGIANLLAKEREQRTFDLISLCPSGPLGMSWAIATGYLHHHRTFKGINEPLNLVERIIVSAGMVVGFGLCVSVASLSTEAVGFPVLILQAIALGLALYIDHVHSLVLAALAGTVAPTLASGRVNAQMYAFTIYVAAQIATYLITFLFGFSLVPELLDLIGLDHFVANVVLIAARLGLFFATRELILIGLWNLLVQQLNADPQEAARLAGRRV